MTDAVLKGEQEKGAVPVLCSTSRLLDVSLRCSPEYTLLCDDSLTGKIPDNESSPNSVVYSRENTIN